MRSMADKKGDWLKMVRPRKFVDLKEFLNFGNEDKSRRAEQMSFIKWKASGKPQIRGDALGRVNP